MQDRLERVVLAYDVGGSHVSAAVCHEEELRLERVVSAPHPADETSAAFVELVVSLGAQAASAFRHVGGAALAMPGPFNYTDGIGEATHKLPYLLGVDLRHALAPRFGWDPCQIRFLNDAAAFLLGEIGAGAARGAARSAGVTLGTGIGASFAVDGNVVKSGSGVPPGGEIWNLPYDGGIVEDMLSSKRIQAAYRQRTGSTRTVAWIAEAASGDAAAAAVFTDYGRHLGRALKLTLAPFRPDVVVLGGSIARSAQLFLPAAESELDGLGFRIAISALFDRAPLVGAGAAWFRAGATAARTEPAAS